MRLTDTTQFSRNRLLEFLPMAARKSSSPALSYSLFAGALYDAAFAFLLVAFPAQIGSAFGLPLPGERFYLWLIAFFLLTLAAFYVLVGRDPGRHRDFLRLAIAARLLGGAVIAAAAIGRADLGGLLAIAAGDLAFGLAHLAFARSPVP